MVHSPLPIPFKGLITFFGNGSLEIMLPDTYEQGSRMSLPNVRHSGEAREWKEGKKSSFSPFDCDIYDSRMLKALAVI